MRKFIVSVIVMLSYAAQAQVGIGTTNPSPKAMLEVSSSSDAGVTYKGFMLPRAAVIANRDAIAPAAIDKGLLVYIEESESIYIWNGGAWETLHQLNAIAFSPVVQNFDLGTSWAYGSDVPFFDNAIDGFYGITTTANGNFSNLTTMTNNFLGVRDLDDEGVNGTPGFATISFNTVDVSSALAGSILSFNYEFFEFDTGDDSFYTIIIDGIDQPEVQLINGLSNLSLAGNVSVNIPGGTNNVSLRFRIRQDGAGDVAGFDNFIVYE